MRTSPFISLAPFLLAVGALPAQDSRETERRALEGELAALTLAWQRAEEIASIADNLLTPPAVEARLTRYKSREIDPRSPG